MDVKRKKVRDRNSFIPLLLNSIQLAKNFSKRCAMTITQKKIMNHITLKFYLRRRFTKLYLYTRVLGNFGSKKEYGEFIRDLQKLVPELKIESKPGNYFGYLLEIKPEIETSLTRFLKIISLLAHPEDFYLKSGKRDYSYFNYINSSEIPIHININQAIINQLETTDLQQYLLNIKPRKIEKCQPNLL